MAKFEQSYQDELTEIYGQEEANAAEENAVELLNVLRDIVETSRKNLQPQLETAELLIEKIENIAHRNAGIDR